jgi:hypothetical protein
MKNNIKFRETIKTLTFIITLVLCLSIFEDWPNFKRGLYGAIPVELVSK